MFQIKSYLLGAIIFLGLTGEAAIAATLIADDEALRPTDPQAGASRGISRGPSIRYELPQDPLVAHQPFDFKVKLEAHGGAKIDLTKVHVTYLKVPSIDLTERLRPYFEADGISMPAAVVPKGEHPIRIDVQDSDGRVSQATFTLSATKPHS